LYSFKWEKVWRGSLFKSIKKGDFMARKTVTHCGNCKIEVSIKKAVIKAGIIACRNIECFKKQLEIKIAANNIRFTSKDAEFALNDTKFALKVFKFFRALVCIPFMLGLEAKNPKGVAMA
jgi:hypothetical protein